MSLQASRDLAIGWTDIEAPVYDRDRDLFIICETLRDGHRWQVSLGEFPDEPMFTLLVDGKRIESFDDWPSAWIRRRQSVRQPAA
jgi:hypothetical protein